MNTPRPLLLTPSTNPYHKEACLMDRIGLRNRPRPNRHERCSIFGYSLSPQYFCNNIDLFITTKKTGIHPTAEVLSSLWY